MDVVVAAASTVPTTDPQLPYRRDRAGALRKGSAEHPAGKRGREGREGESVLSSVLLATANPQVRVGNRPRAHWSLFRFR